MNNLKGTKSEQNLKAAFAGESQARNKYTYYGIKARQEGLIETAELFETMADNEKEHAKIWFNLIHNGLGNTEKNLMDASAGENYEWTDMYVNFAEEAREEGLDALAEMFQKVADIEKYHEKKFLEELIKVTSEKSTGEKIVIEEKSKQAAYRCQFCGHIHLDLSTRPDFCPLCSAIGSFETIMVSI